MYRGPVSRGALAGYRFFAGDDVHAISAGGLGRIEGLVSDGEETSQIAVGQAGRRHPDGHGDTGGHRVDGPPARYDDPRDFLAEPLGDVPGFADAGVRQYHGEARDITER